MSTIKEVKKNYPNARELLQGKHAEELRYEDSPLWSMAELTRIYRKVPLQQYEECTEYANACVDPKNELNVRRWVDDPCCGEKVYPGRWRLVQNGFDKNRQNNGGMLQTLRRGMAQTISWDEALIFNADDLQESERYLLVIVPNFDPQYLESATSALRTTPYLTDPTFQTEQKTGTWECVHIKPEKQEDGSVWIKVLFAIPRFSLTTFDNINTPKETDVAYLWNVPKRLAQALVDTYRFGTGTSAMANYSTAEGLVDLTIRTKTDAAIITITSIKSEDGCLTVEYDDFYFGLTKAQAEAFSIGDAPAGWIYKLIGLSYNADGFWEARVRRSQAVARTISARDIEDSANSTVSRESYYNAESAPSSVSAGSGHRKFIRNLNMTSYCRYNYDLDDEEVHLQEATSWEICSGYTETTERDVHGSALTIPTVEAGTIKTRHNEPDGYGKFNTASRDKVVNDLSATSRIYKKTPGMTIEGGFIIAAAAAPSDPSEYGEVSVQQRDDGRYYGMKVDYTYDEAGDTSWAESVTSGLTSKTRQYAVIDGVRKYRDVTRTYSMYQTKTAYAAWHFISGGEDGSRVDQFALQGGAFGYRAFNVATIDHGAWQTES